MPLDQRIRKLGPPLYGLFKKKGLSPSGKQGSVVRAYSWVVRALNVHGRPSATPPPPLPVELWMKIVHELGRREWTALCRVCWLFYQIAQPCLYEDIILRIWDNFHRRYLKPQRFQRTIDQRQELRAYVHSLILDMADCPTHNRRERYPLLFGLYLFPNLESLQVRHTHFDLELCYIIHSHPRLKSVTVTGCTLDLFLAIWPIDQDHFSHSSISTVNILYPNHHHLIHAWAALASPKLEHLAVRYTSPASDADLILIRIMELNNTSCLTTLHLDTFSPAVVRFLIASPQLRHLLLDSQLPQYNLVSFSLPANAIPFLEDYCGPAEISPTFIRGRPVHTVRLIFARLIPEDRLVEIIISLRYSTVPLTSLGVDFPNGTTGSWSSHIPVTVRYLTIDHLNWLDFEMYLPALSHLTSLHTFSGSFTTILQREDIMKIYITCPSLREIDIGHQIWRIGGKHVGEPFWIDA